MNIKANLISLDNWLLLGLFAITFYPLFYTGYLTNDDAMRHLEVLTGGLFNGTWGIVEATGRITLFFHFILTHISYLIDNFLYRKIFLIVPHLVVILLFSLTLFTYIGSKTVSILFCILFLAFFTNSWDHNLYGSYPFAFHVSITCIILSAYFLHKYLNCLRQKYLIVSVFSYCMAIITYEQFLIYLVFILFTILFSPHKKFAFSINHSFKIALPFLFFSALFLFTWFIIKYLMPGTYSGTSFADFNFFRFSKTLGNYIASAFPLYIPFHYVDRIEHGAASYDNYTICFIWVAKSLIISALTFRTLSRSDYIPPTKMISRQSLAIFLLLIMSVLLISLSEKYQHWVIDAKSLAYSSSTYCAQLLGAALIAVLLTYISTTKIAKSYPLTHFAFMIACITYIVLVTEMHNYDVLAEQKNSANKWAALDSLYHSGRLSEIPSGSIIYGPKFIQTGGIVNLSERYWSSFTLAKYNIAVNITGDIYKLCDPKYIGKKFYLDYISHYPYSKYSVVITKSNLNNYPITIPNYEQTGFYGVEYDTSKKPFRWSNKSSSLIVCNPTDKPVDVVFIATVQTDAVRTNPLTICFLEHCNNYLLSSVPTKVKENYILPPGYHSIYFRTDAEPVNAPNDPRSLFFTLRDFEIKEN